jgi:hypothetical protein
MPKGVYPRKKKESTAPAFLKPIPKTSPLVDSLKPELKKLAEDEIKVAFVENPELKEAVREKVADVLLTRGGRQVIASSDALGYLKKFLGLELASMVTSIEEKRYTAFLAGKDDPTATQSRNIAAAYVIVDILLSTLAVSVVKEWLTEYSAYLYGVPAIEISRRPDDVRTAALSRTMGGEEEFVI